MSKLMTSDTSFKVSLPYKRKLILVTESNNPKTGEIQAAIKQAIEHLEEPVDFKVLDPEKVGRKLGAEVLEIPTVAFLEDDVVVWKKSGIVRPETLWAVMTRKPVYNQPGRLVVPMNPHL